MLKSNQREDPWVAYAPVAGLIPLLIWAAQAGLHRMLNNQKRGQGVGRGEGVRDGPGGVNRRNEE